MIFILKEEEEASVCLKFARLSEGLCVVNV